MTYPGFKGYPDVMLYANHSRIFAGNKFVYPVLSRRSKGISVGINLNPDRVCNFNCIYCQVDRREKGTDLFSLEGKINLSPFPVDIKLISSELRETLDLVGSGRLFSIPPFDKTPPELRHLSDIAISGDGEPTTCPDFYEVVEEVIRVKKDVIPAKLLPAEPAPAVVSRGIKQGAGIQNDSKGLDSHFRGNDRHLDVFSDETKIVLLTNTSGLSRPWVQDAIDLIHKNNGEVWVKLDAGSDEYFKEVSRTRISFKDILHNIILTARRHPVVIQSCFNKIEGNPPPSEEIEIYCNILKEIRENGGMIRLVQIYTMARPPAEDYVAPLNEVELTFIAVKVKKIAGLPAEVFLGREPM